MSKYPKGHRPKRSAFDLFVSRVLTVVISAVFLATYLHVERGVPLAVAFK